ncbi:hypothetical protein HDU87_008276 [Geranomyces variabilis]|uniref:t-SNARE coiled-coil homology domain-containing protein n=1 Tax=Geranomyces variabilis TaxID=109894 RepID=A0AAD5XJ65_9FUNG|nr:hypothetical protein HDU87_008276 [Geranomyces variabilis]
MPANDIETGPLGTSPTSDWSKERFSLDLLSEDASALILERKHAARTGVSTVELDVQIETTLAKFKAGVARLEESLSVAEEESGRDPGDLRQWEEAVLQLSQQYDRLEIMARGEEGGLAAARQTLLARPTSSPRQAAPKGKAVRFNEPLGGADGDDSEDDHPQGALQLQQRIMDDQDTQLDELSATIGRQKQIGIMINDELDLHVDLLLETEDRVDSTQRRLAGAGRRLERVFKDGARNSKGSTVICILVCILILVIVAARKF